MRFLAIGLVLLLGGCGGTWRVVYDQPVDPDVARGWRVVDVQVTAAGSLTISEDNTFAPNADIVWHGEPYGDRRAQVAAIIDEGMTKGASGLHGKRSVIISV